MRGRRPWQSNISDLMQKLSNQQLENLRISGRILASALREASSYVRPGITTMSLDEVAERALRRSGAIPSFKNYFVKGAGRFPASLCVSVNEELVHGIPHDQRVLKNGDIVSLDLGANYKGIFTDMAMTCGVGKIKLEDKKLISVTKNVLEQSIKILKPGMQIGDFGNFIENYIKNAGFVVIRDLVGHGVGLAPHTEPQVPNFGQKGKGIVIEEGMVLAIEPMVSTLSHEVKTAKDGWTIKMVQGQRCAHFEHTVLVTKTGAEVITK